jgi:aspartyl-tRNA(Asn)/glutamyl-tRNA(Gln) amidotransferase subunit A
MERRVQAFLTLTPELSRDRASSLDDALARGEPAGKLAGVPVAVKDVLTTRGVRTTAGSRVLENYVPPYDATAVSRLLAEGAVILGKTNLDEFAMGSSTENSAFQKTRNPWDPDRVPGGSSGGSAAAVAAREVPAALGSDTGGSIRQPAALSGVVGLKPTYGRVSRYGLIAFASSLDQVGPLCRTVEDAALFLEVLSGHDPLDSTSSAVPVADYRAQLDGGVAGLNLGIPRKALEQGLQADVRESYDRAVALLEGVGARTIEVDLPHAELAVACYYLIATAEASSNLARYDGVRYGRRAEAHLSLPEMYGATRDQGFGTEVKRRILLGTYVLSAGYYEAYYLKAQKVRTLIARDFHQAFERVDAVLLPTSPTTAFRFGERLQDPLQMYLSDVFTITANLAGIPGISIPAGLDREGLPVGVQILGRHFDEATVLRVARALEKLAGFENVPRPPLAD